MVLAKAYAQLTPPLLTLADSARVCWRCAMGNEKRVVPRWMRTTAVIGLVLFLSLAAASALAGNWLLALGMLAFTLMQVTLLLTTTSRC